MKDYNVISEHPFVVEMTNWRKWKTKHLKWWHDLTYKRDDDY